MSAHPLRIGIFGSALDTGNLGVSALGMASVFGLSGSGRSLSFTIFDHGAGARARELRGPRGALPVRLLGCAHSRRVYRAGNLAVMHATLRLGLGKLQPMVRELGELDAIFDLSGGDSFGDLYGAWRFRAVTLPKLVALRLGRPLILLPQTYGPFREPGSRATAAGILRKARQSWARDARSFELLKGLLGDDFDAGRHRLGVDVAFGLPAVEPRDGEAAAQIHDFRRRFPLRLGLNVSGLLYHGSAASNGEFGLRAPYRETVARVLRRLLATKDAGVLLVPHVVPPCSEAESDGSACRELVGTLEPQYAARVQVAPELRDPMEAKWVIGQTDWFCGTRMHSCIAALSQGVPTAGIAYSDKALGVFETAGAGDALLDARALGSEQIAERVGASVECRAEAVARLSSGRASVEETLRRQFRAALSTLD
jgi:polysaccharide pyruvyl transferase WcaK-like protein